jgi:hypothetical protein
MEAGDEWKHNFFFMILSSLNAWGLKVKIDERTKFHLKYHSIDFHLFFAVILVLRLLSHYHKKNSNLARFKLLLFMSFYGRNRAFARSLKYMHFLFLPENMLKKLLKSKFSEFLSHSLIFLFNFEICNSWL